MLERQYQIVVTQSGGQVVQLGPQPLNDAEARAALLRDGMEDSEIEDVRIETRRLTYTDWKPINAS